MLAYAPQAWTSDDTDAIERLAIQWGTSLAYPTSSMGAHVSAVPNHQVGRLTPLATRAAVAFFGVFGYELDPTALTERRAGGDPRPDRVLPRAPRRSSSAVGSSGSAARSRATATRRPGWSVSDDRAAGDRRLLPGPDPAGAGGRIGCALRGLDPAPRLPGLDLAGERRRGRPGERAHPARATTCTPTGCSSTWSATRPPATATSGRACSCSRRSERHTGRDPRIRRPERRPVDGVDLEDHRRQAGSGGVVAFDGRPERVDRLAADEVDGRAAEAGAGQPGGDHARARASRSRPGRRARAS